MFKKFEINSTPACVGSFFTNRGGVAVVGVVDAVAGVVVVAGEMPALQDRDCTRQRSVVDNFRHQDPVRAAAAFVEHKFRWA